MWGLLRLLLLLSWAGAAYLAVLLAVAVPPAGVAAVVLGMLLLRRKPKPLTEYGTARWADARDLEDFIHE